MSLKLNNDVLSIITIYSGIHLRYSKKSLKIDVSNKCESCNERMRRTINSIVETYVLPQLLEIDDNFFLQKSKYIRACNTIVLYNKQFIPFNKALLNGLIIYNDDYKFRNDDLYGSKIIRNNKNIKIYVKKIPSLVNLYKGMLEVLNLQTIPELLNVLKEYNKNGINKNIMKQCIKYIHILDIPKKIVIRLCRNCRIKIKKGYIFV